MCSHSKTSHRSDRYGIPKKNKRCERDCSSRAEPTNRQGESFSNKIPSHPSNEHHNAKKTKRNQSNGTCKARMIAAAANGSRFSYSTVTGVDMETQLAIPLGGGMGTFQSKLG